MVAGLEQRLAYFAGGRPASPPAEWPSQPVFDRWYEILTCWLNGGLSVTSQPGIPASPGTSTAVSDPSPLALNVGMKDRALLLAHQHLDHIRAGPTAVRFMDI